jgi:hypothetical protein
MDQIRRVYPYAKVIEGELVVFLIGMRIDKPWKLHKWLPVFLTMPKMLKQLEAHPESGFLGHTVLGAPWFSTGAPSSIWRHMHAPKAKSIGLPGLNLTGGLERAGAMSASGTKLTSSNR